MGTPGPDPKLLHDSIVEMMEERRGSAPYEPWTATEIADRGDVSRVTALKRLRELEDQGRVESKVVGSSARVFWLTSDRDR